MAMFRPAEASGERSTGAPDELDEHDATNTESATADKTGIFDQNLNAITK